VGAERDGAAVDEELVVELAATGRAVLVPAGESILEALLDAGVDVPFSCMEGICGSCRTTVLDGVPRHRDSVLTAAERAAGDSILVCCSGAEGGRIVLDL
jgi:vanillate O-demethylase ferredoxin subunit